MANIRQKRVVSKRSAYPATLATLVVVKAEGVLVSQKKIVDVSESKERLSYGLVVKAYSDANHQRI